MADQPPPEQAPMEQPPPAEQPPMDQPPPVDQPPVEVAALAPPSAMEQPASMEQPPAAAQEAAKPVEPPPLECLCISGTTAAPEQGCGKLIEINAVHVKPKYLLQYVAAVPKGTELLAKHGGKPIGQWMTEAGGQMNPEILFIAEWGKSSSLYPGPTPKFRASGAKFPRGGSGTRRFTQI